MPVASILARAQRDMRSQRMQRAIRHGTDIPYLPATYVTITSFGLSLPGCKWLPVCIRGTGPRTGGTGRRRRSQLSCLLVSPVSFNMTVRRRSEQRSWTRVEELAGKQLSLCCDIRSQGRKGNEISISGSRRVDRHSPRMGLARTTQWARRNADRMWADRSNASSRNVCGGRDDGSSLDVWAIAAQVSSWALRVI